MRYFKTFEDRLIYHTKKSSRYIHTKDCKRAAKITDRFFVQKIDPFFSHKINGESCENNDSIFYMKNRVDFLLQKFVFFCVKITNRFFV